MGKSYLEVNTENVTQCNPILPKNKAYIYTSLHYRHSTLKRNGKIVIFKLILTTLKYKLLYLRD